MLHVHRSERSDHLVAALGEVLADPLPDPLATEVVAVHSRGIERWIAQELATRLGTGALGTDGVSANLDFPFPGRLIRAAVAAGSRVDPEHDPWLPERLTWPLLGLVDAHPDDPMLGPLRTHVGGDGGAAQPEGLARRFGAVRHVADLFDRYGVHRPEMIDRWRAGGDTGPDGATLDERHRWQPALWRAVRERLDVPSFAERRDAALRAIERDPDLLDLPPRLALFGLTALPASYLTVLTAIAAHREVHLLLLHPSPQLWDRVTDATHEAGGQQLWPRDGDPTAKLPRNPLLRSWGRDARELQLVAPLPGDPALRHHRHAPADTEPTTLLGRLQADLRADRAPAGRAGSDADKPPLDPSDRSVQVHDCHGRLRQVEVLRDAIHHLLAEQPDLEPRDVIVMCPDIEAFAPLVTAVFGAEAVTRDETAGAVADDAPPALRVRLADRSLRRTNPVLEVVSLVLDLVDSRVTASAVLDLLSREPVRRRFGFDDDEVDTLESWIADLQIRWGLDGEHRRRNGLPAFEANTWRAGLERLQLGIAMADEDLRLVEGVAPYDGVEGRTNDLAGRLVELVERLRRVLEAMEAPRTIAAWREAIGAAADGLTATDPATTWQRLQLHRVLDDLVDEATLDGTVSPVELTLGEVKSLLSERLAGRPSTTSHRTGELTVCTLVPMRSVPHRVVCLLGLDDGAFPRQRVPDSDDLLLQAPRVGDRDPRSEDRQLLLDALLAATETLVVTYAGRDERTNEERPPAVPVDELLDVVDRTVAAGTDRTVAAGTDRTVAAGADGTAAAGDGRPRDHVTVRHPLAEHDPRNFEPGALRGGDEPWGFHPATLAAARAQRGEAAEPPPFIAAELPLPAEDVIDLDDLVAFLQHPVKAFVRQRLEVTLPGEEDELSDAVPVSLEGLDAWRVGEALLQSWRAGEDLDRTTEVLRARGVIPPGDLAAADLRTVRARVDRIVALCERLGIQPGRRRTVDVEVELPDGRLLGGTVPDVADWRVEVVGYSRVAAKHRLASWVRLLAVTADTPDRPWQAATVGRHEYKGGDRVEARLLSPRGADAHDVRAGAVARLQRLVDLYDRGRRTPLPLYCKTSAKVAQNLYRDRDAVSYVDKEWETAPQLGFEREDLDPYHLLVLGGQRTVDDLFAERCRDEQEASWAGDDRRVVGYAWRLWEPILEVERRCEA